MVDYLAGMTDRYAFDRAIALVKPGATTADILASVGPRKLDLRATGQVGVAMRQILLERAFPADEVRFFASARSAGKTLALGDREVVVAEDELPEPGVIERRGRPDSGIAIVANLMGFAVVDVNMRGTGCSGGSIMQQALRAQDLLAQRGLLAAHRFVRTASHLPMRPARPWRSVTWLSPEALDRLLSGDSVGHGARSVHITEVE